MDQDVLAAARRALERDGGLGAAIALWADGRTVLEAGLGWQDDGRTVPMPGDALLQTFSISKTLFAVVALRLAEDGVLSLDATVPGCPAGVTPRRLLNHTAGVPDYGVVPAYHEAVRASPGRAWTRAEFMAHTVGASGIGPPGTFAYSNTGYMLLREAIELTSGQPMAVLLRRFVWMPLGLPRSRLAEIWDDARDLAPGWTALWGGQQDAAGLYDPGWVAMRSVLAPAGEVAAVFGALRSGRLVSEAALANTDAPELGRRIAAAMLEACWTD